MRLTDWIFAFVHGFRYESGKAKEELEFLEPFVKEQMLTSPCQVEAIQFSKPYRVVLLFFFDKKKQDLLIHIFQEKWSSQDLTVKRLTSKYSALKVNHEDLRKLIGRCRDYPRNSIYAIDFIKNVCCICFTRDPREKGSPFPWSLNYITNPQETGEMIFTLNLIQASTYFSTRE
jgi:hypothetical protein